MSNMLRAEEKSGHPVQAREAVPEEPSLKGTFVSVVILGGILALSWLGAFLLFIIRD